MIQRALALTMIVTSLASVLFGADWPAFRGPGNDGIALDTTGPTKWSSEENVIWKTPLPRPGNGSPIVVGGKVFVTSAEDEAGKERSLYCFDAKSGAQLWKRTAEVAEEMPTHKTNPYGGTTPVSDGKRVVVWHATGGLHCYDLDGKELWTRDLGEFRHIWGYGTSPILHGKQVILHTGPGKRVFVTAIDIETGETVWETEEPIEKEGLHNNDGQYQGSWSTPLITRIDGRDQAILMLNTRVNGYDLATGEIIWSCLGLRHAKGDLAYSAPVIVGDICMVTGGFQGPALAFRLGGSGDITEANRLWRKEKQPQNIGSGVAANGHVFRPNAGPGTIDCIDPKTGETKWQSRAGGSQWASILKIGDLLYATSQAGETTIFKPNPDEFEQVAKNDLKDPCNATPAAANGRLYFRTAGFLWAIGE